MSTYYQLQHHAGESPGSCQDKSMGWTQARNITRQSLCLCCFLLYLSISFIPFESHISLFARASQYWKMKMWTLYHGTTCHWYWLNRYNGPYPPRCSQLITNYDSLGSLPSRKPACYIEKITKLATSPPISAFTCKSHTWYCSCLTGFEYHDKLTYIQTCGGEFMTL